MNVSKLPLEKKKRLIKLLNNSKKHLWNGHKNKDGTEFVCFAIQVASDSSNIFNRDPNFLREWIVDSIAPFTTVTCWLNSLGYTGNIKDTQSYRLRWIDSMIKQLSV